MYTWALEGVYMYVHECICHRYCCVHMTAVRDVRRSIIMHESSIPQVLALRMHMYMYIYTGMPES